MSVRYEDLGPHLLIRFYVLAIHSGADGSVYAGRWDDVRPYSISNTLISRKSRELIAAGLLIEENSGEDHDPQYQTSIVSISDDGILAVESTLEKLQHLNIDLKTSLDSLPSSLIQDLKKEISGSDNKAVRPLSSENLVPASDRIVRRDDNSAAYQAAAKALDDSISAIEMANDIGDLTADERSIVLSQLREGRRLFEFPEIKLNAVRTLIEPKLRWLIDKAGGGLVAAAALAALKALASLFGIS